MLRDASKVQLVFCRHTAGRLANESDVQPQPPLGLLVLASFLKQKLPHIDVEVLDGKILATEHLLSVLDAPVIGFSVWFSNYEESCLLARCTSS